DQLRFLNTPLSADLSSLKSRDYLVARGLRSLVLEHGHQRARQLLNARSKRNASRIFEKFEEFLEGDETDGRGISEGGLYGRYCESVRRQIEAKGVVDGTVVGS